MTDTVAASLPGDTRVAVDPIGVAADAAQLLSTISASGDSFGVALSGGSTPHFLYEALASSTYREHIDWARWHVFFSDERAVPPDHAASNFRLAHDALLAKVPIPSGQIHRMPAERPDLDRAAAEYSHLLAATRGQPPRLEVVLLGLGDNGHTASLFPDTPALEVGDAWATRGIADYAPIDRITLTLPAINAASNVVFLVTGGSKAAALRAVIDGSAPAARVRPEDGRLLWLLDRAAAASMERPAPR